MEATQKISTDILTTPNPDLLLRRPQIHEMTREFTPIVTAQKLERPTTGCQSIQHGHHMLTSKPLAPTTSALAFSTSQEKGDYEARLTPIYDFTVEGIYGKPRTFGEFKGKVIMTLNTASYCGHSKV
jgi:hypothetical protein